MSSFKIVFSTENTAISFDHEDLELKKKAANVFYHLTKARNFWLKEIKSDYVKNMPQIVVRLDITNAFSNLRHFKNAELEKNNNNAWTIPEGKTPRSAKVQESWGKEIWFNPMKKIETRDIVPESDGNNPVHESLLLLKDPIISTNKTNLIYQGLGMTIYPSINNSSLLELALKRVGSIALMFGLVEVTKHMDHWFMDKYYYLETAMIPEVIYHEFAHIAMSDTMKTVHSVPVIEGMADYFAARISNSEKMYKNIENYSSNRSRDTKSKSLYSPYLEGAWNATNEFTLSLLWRGKTEFDKLNQKRLSKGLPIIADYDQLVFSTHKNLNENSDIANDLTRALVDACKLECENLRMGINTLNYVFEAKGLN